MRNEPLVWPEVGDAGTRGAGAVPLRSAQMMGQQQQKYIKKYDCRSDLAPKHARKHETHPPRVKKKRKKRGVPSQFKLLVVFELAKQHGQLQNKLLI